MLQRRTKPVRSLKRKPAIPNFDPIALGRLKAGYRARYIARAAVLAEAIAHGATQREAAARAGITPENARKIMRMPLFRSAMRKSAYRVARSASAVNTGARALAAARQFQATSMPATADPRPGLKT